MIDLHNAGFYDHDDVQIIIDDTPPTHTLHINVVPPEGGTVAFEASGDVEPREDFWIIEAGAVVTALATPNEGWEFTGWEDLATTTNPVVITMDEDQALTATFAVATGMLVGQATTQFHGPEGLPLTVKGVQDGTVAFTHTVTLDPSGTFTVTDVMSGTYDVWVKHAHTLAPRVDDVTIVAGGTTTAGVRPLPLGHAGLAGLFSPCFRPAGRLSRVPAAVITSPINTRPAITMNIPL